MKLIVHFKNRTGIIGILCLVINLFFMGCKKNNDAQGKPGNNPVAACDEVPLSNVPFTACGNILFKLPEGWQLQADGENFLLQLPFVSGNPDRIIQMYVVKGFTSSGNLETDYNTFWQKYLSDFTKYQEPFLIKEKSIKGYDIIRGGTNVRSNTIVSYAHLWVAKVNDQAEAVFTIANYNNDFDISYYGDIAPFWARLQFKNLPEPAKSCYTLRGNGVQGIYYGLSNGLNIYGDYGKKLTMLLVYNDNKMKRLPYGVLPATGLNMFDREVDREVNKDYWADYNLQSGKATFYGTPVQVKSFTYSNNKVYYDNEEYVKLPAVDGLTLEGIYTADDKPLAVATFGHEPTITFYKDGRFEDNTALYYVDNIDEKFKRPGDGKYTINNYSIELTYSDGRGSATFPFVNFDKDKVSSIQIKNVFIFKK
jgi:hypothetical protein